MEISWRGKKYDDPALLDSSMAAAKVFPTDMGSVRGVKSSPQGREPPGLNRDPSNARTIESIFVVPNGFHPVADIGSKWVGVVLHCWLVAGSGRVPFVPEWGTSSNAMAEEVSVTTFGPMVLWECVD